MVNMSSIDNEYHKQRQKHLKEILDAFKDDPIEFIPISEDAKIAKRKATEQERPHCEKHQEYDSDCWACFVKVLRYGEVYKQ